MGDPDYKVEWNDYLNSLRTSHLPGPKLERYRDALKAYCQRTKYEPEIRALAMAYQPKEPIPVSVEGLDKGKGVLRLFTVLSDHAPSLDEERRYDLWNVTEAQGAVWSSYSDLPIDFQFLFEADLPEGKDLQERFGEYAKSALPESLVLPVVPRDPAG